MTDIWESMTPTEHLAIVIGLILTAALVAILLAIRIESYKGRFGTIGFGAGEVPQPSDEAMSEPRTVAQQDQVITWLIQTVSTHTTDLASVRTKLEETLKKLADALEERDRLAKRVAELEAAALTREEVHAEEIKLVREQLLAAEELVADLRRKLRDLGG